MRKRERERGSYSFLSVFFSGQWFCPSVADIATLSVPRRRHCRGRRRRRRRRHGKKQR